MGRCNEALIKLHKPYGSENSGPYLFKEISIIVATATIIVIQLICKTLSGEGLE